MSKKNAKKNAVTHEKPAKVVQAEPEKPAKAKEQEAADIAEHDRLEAKSKEHAERRMKAKADTVSDTPSPTPSEPVKAVEPEPPAKPCITYEVLESGGTDDQFEYARVNVTVTPAFNGFSEAIITVPVPIHNSKGIAQKGDREALIREKALWKVNSQVGPGAQQFTAEDVKAAGKA